MRLILRSILTLCLIFGILWPKTSAALIDLGLVNAQFYVVCTGDGIELLVVADSGNEVNIDAEPLPCIAAHGTLLLDEVELPLVPHEFEHTEFPPSNEVQGSLSPTSIKLARAPPVV